MIASRMFLGQNQDASIIIQNIFFRWLLKSLFRIGIGVDFCQFHADVHNLYGGALTLLYINSIWLITSRLKYDMKIVLISAVSAFNPFILGEFKLTCRAQAD